MMRFTLLLCLPLAVGCSTAPPEGPSFSDISVASQEAVASCAQLTVITTTTGVFGTLGQERALELAREDTLRTAREAGANTIVYENGAPGTDDVFVRAGAYVC